MKLNLIISVLCFGLFGKSNAQTDTLLYDQSERQLHYNFKQMLGVEILRHVTDSLKMEFTLINKSNVRIAVNENIEIDEDVDTCNLYVGYLPLSDHESFAYTTVIIYPNEKYVFALSERKIFYRYNVATLVSMNGDEIIKNAPKENIKADKSRVTKTVQRSSDDGINMTPFIEIFIRNIYDASSHAKTKMYGRVRK
ncbi:MAG: hypothetical protein JNM41_13920 [Flavipsychrobacter sp.]|nr:hypothetical protein [Flavipsychrobacter sp.]